MAQFSNYTAIDAPADADIFLVYDDSAGATRKVTLQQLGDYIDTDQGFVTGPGSSTDNAVARFDATTGKIVQNSGVIIDDSNNVTGVASLTATTLAGTLSTATQNSVTTMTGLVTVGTIGTGVWEATDIAVLHGGTGASTAADARTNLGLAIGTNVQAYSATLDALIASPLTASTAASTYLTIASAASTYQPLDADLTAIAALSSADGNFIVGSATGWVAESGSTARTSLGLGTGDNVQFTNGTFTGTLDVAGRILSGSGSALSIGTNITTMTIRGGAVGRSGGVYLTSSDDSQQAYMYVADTLARVGTATAHDFLIVRGGTERARATSSGVTVTGTLGVSTSATVASDLTLASGSITSASGAISFSNENLSTTGTLASGNATVTGTLGVTGVFTNTSTGTSYFSQPTALVLGTTATSSNAQFYATKTYGAASGDDYGTYLNYTQSVATTGSMQSLVTIATASHTTGTVGALYGNVALARATGAGGTTTNVYGIWARVQNTNASAVITNAYGLYVNAFTATGTITNRWGIYQAGASENNYLAGSLRIGTTSAAGNEILRVNGLIHSDSDSIIIDTAKTPASAGATGTQGQVAWDADYIYVCTATDTWKRAAIATWP